MSSYVTARRERSGRRHSIAGAEHIHRWLWRRAKSYRVAARKLDGMQSLTVCLRYLKIALPTRVLGSVASAALASARAAALDVERNKSCSKAIATAQGDDAVL